MLKETGGCCLAKWMVFMGTTAKPVYLSKGNLPEPCLVLATPIRFYRELFIFADALINSSFHEANPWNEFHSQRESFLPVLRCYSTELAGCVHWFSAVSGKLIQLWGAHLVFTCVHVMVSSNPLSSEIFINWPNGSDPVLDSGEGVMDETNKIHFSWS